MRARSRIRVGVISDTHGLVRPEALEAMKGSARIIHAGDIGGDDVIEQLAAIAPVTWVPGNIDDGAGREIARLTIDGLRILLTHVLPRPDQPDRRVLESLRMHQADLVIFGHSHLPHDERQNGIWYFNPASAGPRRFDYPVSVGIIEKTADGWTSRHVALDGRADAVRSRMNQLAK